MYTSGAEAEKDWQRHCFEADARGLSYYINNVRELKI